MYESGFTAYADWSYRHFFQYADRHLYRRVRSALALTGTESLLDVGCDRGQFLETVLPYCREVTAVDINPAAIDECKRRFRRAFVGSADAMPFLPDASVDRIVAIHTIEHVPDVGRALAELGRIVRPGGRVVLVYPLELVRGFSILPSALFVYGDPAMARRMHLHRLSPARLYDDLAATSLSLSHSTLVLWPNLLVPMHISVLVKRA